MSDYSRRNRGRFSESDDFDWESFDRKTAEYSTLSEEDGEVLRRRRASDNAPSRRRRQLTPADSTMSNGRSGSSSRPTPSPAPSRPASRPAAKRKRRQKKRLTEKQLRFRRRLRLSILAVFLVTVVIISGVFVGMYAAVKREIDEMHIEDLTHNQTSEIYYFDKNGELEETVKLHSDINSIWIDSSQISPFFKDAIVAIEDERFYEHNGVDIKRTTGAILGYVTSRFNGGSAGYGGSTITQQTIKNITAEKDQTAARKVKEIMRAIAFEEKFSKEEILGMYCNIAHFANGCDGVEAASLTYFNKHASELNLQEAASIAGITQYPAKYDPFVNPDANVEKRNIVLKKMYELGKINKQQYETAKNSELELDDGYKKQKSEIPSYFEDQLVNDIIDDLVEQKNYTSEFAKRQVYNGGYKIYATADLGVQSAMEAEFETKKLTSSGKELQAGMVITDPYTGQIKGIVGGRGKKETVRGWNRATHAKLQPGSSIKPIGVYAPALDMGKITESSVTKDEEISIAQKTFKNSYSGFKGNMSMKEAVARSANIPAVKVLSVVGIDNSYGYLQNKFHISTLTEDDKNYSALALGGLHTGVTVKEMASAYGVFVNSGKYIEPHTYTQVLDSSGNVVLEHYEEETQVISETAAYITASLLEGPIHFSGGTATSAALSNGMPTYGKTGTTDNDYDKWFVGFTPYYVGAVWYGFDEPASLKKEGVSGNPALDSWKNVFEKISEDQTYDTLDKPKNIAKAEICVISGELARSGCESLTAYYVPGTEPTKRCAGGGHRSSKVTIESDVYEVTGKGSEPTSAPTSAPKATAKPEDDEDDDEDSTPKPTTSASTPKPTTAPATPPPTQQAPPPVTTVPPQTATLPPSSGNEVTTE